MTTRRELATAYLQGRRAEHGGRDPVTLKTLCPYDLKTQGDLVLAWVRGLHGTPGALLAAMQGAPPIPDPEPAVDPSPLTAADLEPDDPILYDGQTGVVVAVVDDTTVTISLDETGEELDVDPAELTLDADELDEPTAEEEAAAAAAILPAGEFAGGADRDAGGADVLRRYWTSGKGAALIAWGTPGDFSRCVEQLDEHMPGRAKGYCALRHKEVTGVYPGDRRNVSAALEHPFTWNIDRGVLVDEDGDEVDLAAWAERKPYKVPKLGKPKELKPVDSTSGTSSGGRDYDRDGDGKFAPEGSGGGGNVAQKGEKGERTQAAQKLLVELGFLDKSSGKNGGADGLFGPATEAALKKAQKAAGLPETGKLDPATITALEKLKKGQKAPARTGKAPARKTPKKAPKKPKADPRAQTVRDTRTDNRDKPVRAMSLQAASPDELPDGWAGVLCPLDTMSGDGRVIARTEQARTRVLPLPLRWQEADNGGHDGAVVIGRIDEAEVREQADGTWALWGRGSFDLGPDDNPNTNARTAARQLAAGVSTGVSVDLDDTVATEDYVAADGTLLDAASILDPKVLPELEQLGIDAAEAVRRGAPVVLPDGARSRMVATDWRLSSATLVAIPAFDQARLVPVYGYTGEPADTGEPLSDAEVLVASAGRTYAAELFAETPLDGPTPLTVTDDGRVFGHLATWGTCHTGFPGQCITPPREETFDLYHQGAVRLDDGRDLPIGKITLGGGHAGPRDNVRATIAHYDNAFGRNRDARPVAVVRAYNDEHGIAVAGSLLPGVTDDEVDALRRSPLSGDWRTYGGRLRLLAALACNVPGFPIVPRALAASAGDVQVSLVAAGVVPPVTADERPLSAGTSPAELARLVAAELRAHSTRARVADRLAARIGRTTQDRVAAAAARIDRKA